MTRVAAILAADGATAARLSALAASGRWRCVVWDETAALPAADHSDVAVLIAADDVPGADVLAALADLARDGQPPPVLQIVRPGATWRSRGPGAAVLCRPFTAAALIRRLDALVDAETTSGVVERAPRWGGTRGGGRPRAATMARAAAASLIVASLVPAREAAASSFGAAVTPTRPSEGLVLADAPSARSHLIPRRAAATQREIATPAARLPDSLRDPRPADTSAAAARLAAVRTGGRLALRADASTRQAALAWMAPGTTVRVLGEAAGQAVEGEDDRWLRVQVGERIGFAYGRYLEPITLADAHTTL